MDKTRRPEKSGAGIMWCVSGRRRLISILNFSDRVRGRTVSFKRLYVVPEVNGKERTGVIQRGWRGLTLVTVLTESL